LYLIFDTETTGLPKNWKAPITDTDNWPRCVQIAWQLHDDLGQVIEHEDYLVIPDGYDIPFDSEKIHGISTELAIQDGIEVREMLEKFNNALKKSKFIVGQNLGFDVNIMGCELIRYDIESNLLDIPVLDTCTEHTAKLCQIPGGRGGKFKLPTLTELHEYLFQVPFSEAHNATADVEATTRCFFELIRREEFTEEELQEADDFFDRFKIANPDVVQGIGLKHQNLKEASAKLKKKTAPGESFGVDKSVGLAELKDVPFTHLHNHSQYSILQATTTVNGLLAKAVSEGMSAVALTDHGNMMAAFHFVKATSGHNKGVRARKKEAEEAGEEFTEKEITPILGCEFFVCEDHLDKTHKDNGYHIVVLAKNKAGYHNVAKMASIAAVSGKYYVPRIDKNVLAEYRDDVIVTTGNLNGEVPSKILNIGEKQAEEAFVWYKEQYGDDFYVELMRHGQEEEDRVNQVLLKFAKKYDVKYIATNNTYYLEKRKAESHDVLLCVRDGELANTPIGRGRGFRFGFPNNEYYFKSSDEMKQLFADLPDAIKNTQEIVDKVEFYELARDVLLPAFDIPDEFTDAKDEEDGGKRGENNYLRHLTYEGAKVRYGELTDEITERLDFELATVAKTGYPGYFLIVWDFLVAAREMGVSVGPGRGSAAGSVVAYCLKITNIDPLKYDLLFERFLNPDRVSMPDIDIDFDDEGRGRIIQWVIDKYGSNQVAQIITYGTMAAKSALRDTARVLDLPLFEADRIAKLVPDISLKKLFGLDDIALAEKLKNNQDDINRANELKSIAAGNDLQARVVNQALELEGSVRNTGIHACGVIITPDDITKYVPVATAKDSEMYCTQFDNSVAEEAGLLKMDFLGLKTLTLIKDAVRIVKEVHDVDLDPENFDLEDELTYELFQRGETVGIFQYESPGMQKYMRDLKPTAFEDLIAMNALYRPGPIEYIPSFIKRKHGLEDIVYDVDDCQEYLEETYGITVYQEQVMLLSQKLAGFTKGEADTLRKAMGKKQKAVLDKMKPLFLTNGGEKGHNVKALEKIWTDWEAFASYAFNKSHSTCYAWIAYQTAWLKAHYPAEYMASVLSNNMNDIKSVTFFMEECRRMGLTVLGPDVNESSLKFAVNKEGAIRFGMGAIKGVGSGPVNAIIAERKEGGFYKSIFDMAKRVDLRQCNKKAFEGLALSGGFDSFKKIHRAQLFSEDSKGRTFLENVMKFGNVYQENLNSSQVSMFGEATGTEAVEPQAPESEEWTSIEKLNKEKEVVGIFISGHPLDDFKLEIDSFCSGNVSMLNDMEKHRNKDVSVPCIVTEVEHRMTKKGDPFGTMIFEDYTDSYKLFLFREDYLRFKHFMVQGAFLYLKGKIQNKMAWGKRLDEMEYKLSSFELLSELKEKKSRYLTLSLSTNDINNSLIEEVHLLFQNYPGNCLVRFDIYDTTENLKVTMPSRSIRVDVSNELVRHLDSLQVVQYAISEK
jgi:DNA polymerase-3 subunit alpha